MTKSTRTTHTAHSAHSTHTSCEIVSGFARGALIYFVVVGILGTWLRARFAGLLPSAVQPANVIHAHSHVAYFGWTSLALFAGIYYVLPKLTGRPLVAVPVIRWQLRLTHVATLGALITFSTGGYTPASIVFSAANGLIWYGFVWVYRKNVVGVPKPLPVPLRYLHVAVVLLVLSSLGTWLISGVTAAGVENPIWYSTGLYVYLTNFTDGWLLIGLLGLVVFIWNSVARQGAQAVDPSGTTIGGPGVRAGTAGGRTETANAANGDSGAPRGGQGDLSGALHGEWAVRPLVWMAALTPLSFLADLAASGLTPTLSAVGVVARIALAVPYGIFFYHAVRTYRQSVLPSSGLSSFVRDRSAPAFLIVASLFFSGKIIAHVSSVIATLGTSRQMFIAYLHLDLLGFVSCGLIGVLYVFAAWRRETLFGQSRAVAAPRTFFGTVDAGTVGAYVLAVGVACMVLALFGLAVVGAIMVPSARGAVVEQLLLAALVSAVVSLVGIVVVSVDLSRAWRGEQPTK